jgi:hypothetical protein
VPPPSAAHRPKLLAVRPPPLASSCISLKKLLCPRPRPRSLVFAPSHTHTHTHTQTHTRGYFLLFPPSSTSRTRFRRFNLFPFLQ